MNIAEQELYLIAHAPQTIPDWFQPKIRPKSNAVIYQGAAFPDIHKYYYDEGDGDEWTDEGKLSEDDKAMYLNHKKKYSDWIDEINKWNDEAEIQRIVQWPIFWAKEVLKQYHS